MPKRSNSKEYGEQTFEEADALYEALRVISDVQLDRAICLTDRRGEIQFWSKGAEIIFDAPINEVCGTNISSFLSEARALEDVPLLLRKKESLTPENQEFKIYLRKNQTSFFCRHFYSAINLRGSRSFYLHIFEDLSQFQHTESVILQNSKLASLGEMVGSIAHEISNPLTIITGRASVISREAQKNPPDTSKIVEYAKKIESTVARVSKIIYGLRSYARGDEEEPFHECTISEIIEDTLEFSRNRFLNHGIELRVPKWKDGRLFCRKVQICQILLNLLGNAFDAVQILSEKWVQLDVSFTDKLVTFTVSDSGKTPPPEITSNFFTQFFTTKKPGSGTGLGLSLSQRFARQHHGDLYCNVSSQNTMFILDLPVDPLFRSK